MRIARGQTLAASFVVMCVLGGSPAAAAPEDALSACLARCSKSKLSETNRATCRLDCEQDAATDPELIRSQIAGNQPAPATAPPSVATPTSPGPGRPVGATPGSTLQGRESCKAQCSADRALSADDRATCRLECDLVEEPGVAAPVSGGVAAPGSLVAAPVTALAQPAAVRPPPSLGLAPSSFLAMCLRTCRKGPVKMNATDQATCTLTCENTASVVDVALDAAPTGWFAVAPAPTVMAASRPPVVAVPTGPAAPGVAVGTPPATAAPVNTCEAARETCQGACAKVRTGCERGCGKTKNETDRETCKLDCGENLGLCAADCVGEHAGCVNRGGR